MHSVLRLGAKLISAHSPWMRGNTVKPFRFFPFRIILRELAKPFGLIRHHNQTERRHYFAITDIDVQASCDCNGMSDKCLPDDYGLCECEKMTEGLNCEKCAPTHGNKYVCLLLFVCLFVSLFVCLFVCLCVWLCVCLFVCVFVFVCMWTMWFIFYWEYKMYLFHSVNFELHCQKSLVILTKYMLYPK